VNPGESIVALSALAIPQPRGTIVIPLVEPAETGVSLRALQKGTWTQLGERELIGSRAVGLYSTWGPEFGEDLSLSLQMVWC
jgi:hypothetical protein